MVGYLTKEKQEGRRLMHHPYESNSLQTGNEKRVLLSQTIRSFFQLSDHTHDGRKRKPICSIRSQRISYACYLGIWLFSIDFPFICDSALTLLPLGFRILRESSVGYFKAAKVYINASNMNSRLLVVKRCSASRAPPVRFKVA